MLILGVMFPRMFQNHKYVGFSFLQNSIAKLSKYDGKDLTDEEKREERKGILEMIYGFKAFEHMNSVRELLDKMWINLMDIDVDLEDVSFDRLI